MMGIRASTHESGGHNSVHNIFLTGFLRCWFTMFTVHHIFLSSPACQHLKVLLTCGNLPLAHGGSPKTWKGSWRNSYIWAQRHVCLRKLTWGTSLPLSSTRQTSGRENQNCWDQVQTVYFSVKIKVQRGGGGQLGLEEQQWAGPRP